MSIDMLADVAIVLENATLWPIWTVSLFAIQCTGSLYTRKKYILQGKQFLLFFII